MMTWLSIFIGGGIGSIFRYGIGLLVKRLLSTPLPIGTFLANSFAALIIGLSFYFLKDKLIPSSWLQPFLIIGFCGGLSTFSTFSNETVQLFNQGNWGWAICNIFVSVSSSILIIYWLKN